MKGTDEIGVAVDGCPIYSDVSPVELTQGEVIDFTIVFLMFRSLALVVFVDSAVYTFSNQG